MQALTKKQCKLIERFIRERKGFIVNLSQQFHTLHPWISYGDFYGVALAGYLRKGSGVFCEGLMQASKEVKNPNYIPLPIARLKILHAFGKLIRSEKKHVPLRGEDLPREEQYANGRAEDYVELRWRIDSLEPLLQVPLKLNLDGYTMQEVAKKIGVSRRTAVDRKSKALKILRERMGVA